MENKIHAYHPPILPGTPPKAKSSSASFKQMLQSEQTLQLSKHASERLQARNIDINETKWQEIDDKLEEARKKGVKESLVLLDDAGLIVNAQNKTVITAMSKQEMSSKIFTNINGTILLD
ncbi:MULTISPECIES: TIGR02530 family flagellar biosynthesis protein [Gracilibacillus]|uniref:TIGR02530 family flagellar biosynthesis protein n=1 Tax=Gracilibacillus TaxID=74385 RepID=UPI00082584DD|nr:MULTISPECIES: TIGR02530 family flagellar biosynthesis protein [Gracilibacillus]